MLSAAGAGHATAADLADWLTRELNMPFRESHHITGRLVRLADEHRMDWAVWFNTVGFSGVDTNKGPVFVDSNGVLDAALAVKVSPFCAARWSGKNLSAALLSTP